MPQVNAFSSTSRRAVLSRLATLPLIGSLAALIPTTRASGRTEALLQARIAQAMKMRRFMKNRAHEFTDDECLTLSDAFDAQLDALAKIRAVTREGLGAKARLIQLYLPPYFRSAEVDERSSEIRLLSSFIEDNTLFARGRAV